MTKTRKKVWIVGGIVALLAMAAAAAGPVMSRVEQPAYKVKNSDGAIEVRNYGPMIAAEVEVKGERKAAINEGFRLIAAYIFGANKPNAKVEMTAPVQQQSVRKIAMTAPVSQQAGDESWTVRFIMPMRWTLETLPIPNDTRVTLKPLPAKCMIAIRFAGTAGDSVIRTKTEELRQYASNRKLTTLGEPQLAFYNPPWTLPLLRRNEVMFEVAASVCG